MIIVCVMFSYDTTNEHNNHDPQTFFKKIAENITKRVDYKLYA